jgi:hypothetical protein
MPINGDDEKTIIGQHFAGNVLPIGTQLAEFEITGLIGEGGFGIVYDAYDRSLHRKVALKEYMPSALAARANGISVGVKSERHRETFDAGLRSFVNEARLLAHFDHPSLVKVYRFWEANGTAYMVMPFYHGPTLKQALKDLGGSPEEKWLKRLLAELLNALDVLHRDDCFHRDIAPDNILLLKDGRSLLLDFGAARRVIGDMTQALTVILKPGYAPVEQYAEMPQMKQGPWTDIYALAAVVYFAITGRAPEPSVARLMQDELAPLSQAAGGRYTEKFLRGIDRALAVRPEDRPQSVAEFRKLLGLEDSTPVPDSTSLREAQAEKSRLASLGVGLAIAVAAFALIGGLVFILSLMEAQPERGASRGTIPSNETAITAGRAILEAPVQEESMSPRKPSALKPFDAIEALNELFEARDRNHAITVVPDKTKVTIGKDRLRFRLRSSKPGYLYILMVGTERGHFNLLFPNAIDSKNRIDADKEVSLPRPGWTMMASGPPGTNQFLALVSAHPREFSAAGLRQVDLFGEFPHEQAAKVAQTIGAAAFAGTPVCPAGAACSEAYGAAMFVIEEVP